MKTILSRTTIVVVAIALLLTVFSCGKDKEAPKPTYVQLQTGLQDVEKTYLIDGVTKITWKVPGGDAQTRISILVGDEQLMGQQMSAVGTQPAELVLTTTKNHARFTTNKPTVKQVEIISIE
jgi:hypothetical protein